MLKKTTKILLGLALLPFCAGFTWQFGAAVFSMAYKPELPYYFLAGGLAYLCVHILFKKPILTYVFGHELTHAFFAVLFGGSVKSFQASERGGRVTITKSNFIITLAPYFFPLYTFAALIFYWLAAAANVRWAAGWSIFFAGAAFSFHLILTFFFLQTDQSDIKEHGAVFSYPLIYLFNVLFAAFLVHALLSKNPGFLGFLGNGIMKSVTMTSRVIGKLYEIGRSMM
jgi:Peptidase M50B-like